MASDPKAMVKEGIRLYKANQKAEARAIWEQVTELDPYNEQAWLWLSAVVESSDDQRVCLENVLFINPDNPNAKKGIAALDAKKASGTSSSGASTAAPSAPKPAAPSRPASPSIPTSSASSTFVPDSTPPEVYDDWIGSLNLPNSGKQSSKTEEPAADAWSVPDDLPASSPFTTTDFEPLDDGNAFSPFTASDSADTSPFGDFGDEGDSYEVFTPSNKVSAAPSIPAFIPSDDLGSDDLRALMASDDDDDDDLYSSSPSNSSASSPAFRNFSLDEDEMEDDDDVFGDDFAFTNPSASSASSASSRSGGASQRDEYDLGDDPFSPNPFPDSTLPKTNPFTSADLDFDAPIGGSGGTGYGVATLGEDADPAEYFAMIPESIRPRQLPGTSEKYPFILRLMFILLVLLNIGAVVLLVIQLVS